MVTITIVFPPVPGSGLRWSCRSSFWFVFDFKNVDSERLLEANVSVLSSWCQNAAAMLGYQNDAALLLHMKPIVLHLCCSWIRNIILKPHNLVTVSTQFVPKYPTFSPDGGHVDIAANLHVCRRRR